MVPQDSCGGGGSSRDEPTGDEEMNSSLDSFEAEVARLIPLKRAQSSTDMKRGHNRTDINEARPQDQARPQ